jgi:predicted nucleic acid-binding protein
MLIPRVYLDTSVISHLDQPKKPVEQEYSLRLWDAVMRGEFEVWISDVVIKEINRCKPEKVERLQWYLTKIKYRTLLLSDELISLARIILEKKILPSKCDEDSQHIAAAILTKSDFLLSWNLKHLANFKTNERIRTLTLDEHIHTVNIIQPSYLLEGDINYDKRTSPAPRDQ